MTTTRLCTVLLALATIWAIAPLPRACAQTTTTAPALSTQPEPGELTIETVQRRLDALKDSTRLTPEMQEKVRGLLTQALAELQSAKAHTEAMARLDADRDAAPGALAAAQAELARPLPLPQIDAPADAPLELLEQQLTNARAALAGAKARVTEVEGQISRRGERRNAIPAILARTRQTLDDLRQELAATVVGQRSPDTYAQRSYKRARILNLERALEHSERELLYYDATAELLTTQRDLAKRNERQATRIVELWQERLVEFQKRQAEKTLAQAELAKRELGDAPPVVQTLAQANLDLARTQDEIASRIPRVTEDADKAAALAQQLPKDFESLRRRIEKTGVTETVGMFMSRTRAQLPNAAIVTQASRQYRRDLSETEVQEFLLDQQRSELATDMEGAVARYMAQAPASLSGDQRQAVELAIRELLADRQRSLEALLRTLNTYQAQLTKVTLANEEVLSVAGKFRAYINENILWFRSSGVLGSHDLLASAEAVHWLVSPSQWSALVLGLWDDLAANVPLYLLAIAVLAGLLIVRRMARGRVAQIGLAVARMQDDRFARTLQVLGLTLVKVLPYPLLMAFIAWRLTAPLNAGTFTFAIAHGLRTTAWIFGTFLLLQKICAEDGLAHRHFRWNFRGLRILHRNIHWLLASVLPLVFLAAVMDAQDLQARRDSLGRLAYIAATLLFMAFLIRVLRPKSGVFMETLQTHRGGWIDRLRFFWYPLAVLTPLWLAVLAAWGYYYTALQLSQRLMATIWMLLTLAVLFGLTLRALMLARRKIALEQARKHQEPAGVESSASGLGEEPGIDILTVSAQTLQLVRSAFWFALLMGLWLIWEDVLPALKALQKVNLWHVGGQTISLADLGLGLVIFVMTLIAARNVPALLEIAILQHLPLDSGIRFAVSAISRYVIGAVGVVITFSSLGIGWDKVQWLVAAVTVGLGFGLQEIFANFVSGLIILFERPIRVGDVVTIGNVTGTVTQIRIRATTVTDWDRKELIVPNKEFVTGSLINWTLSDTLLRLTFRVGVAYGSDTALAHRLLLDVAESNSMVMGDPPPLAAFMSFGESTLDFELRVFINDVTNILPVTNALNMAIEQVFRKHNIEIAFPQRDVHIRSICMPLEFRNAVPTDRDGTPRTQT